MNTLARSAVGAAAIALTGLAIGVAAQSATDAAVPSSAEPLGAVPATLTGKADAKKLEDGAPVPFCASVKGVEWYTVRAPGRGPMMARLVARGDLDAVVAVYRISRSQRTSLVCAATNAEGRAWAAWYGYPTGSYLIGVGRRVGSSSGEFELRVSAAEPAARAPGDVLPVAGATSTINSVLDRTDAWAVQLARGTTYRLNLATLSPADCVSYALYRPGTTSFVNTAPVLDKQCGGYADFTPGIDGGGVYSVVVRGEPGDPLTHQYRVEVGAAGKDDTAPGTSVSNGQVVSGGLAGLDAVDLYRFVVAREGELTTVRLGQKPRVGVDLRILDEMGRRQAASNAGTGPQVLRLHLPAGRYYAALQTRAGRGGGYSLQVQVRDVTTTTITAGGGRAVEIPPSSAVPLTVFVTSASHGGRVLVEIDHYDPLFGWHYDSSLAGQVSSSGQWTTAWTPPSVGVWRARARFVGNAYSSYSSSDYATVHVVEPLE